MLRLSIEVTSGVPQGSVLGPLLFLIYINDIPERISSSTYLFADNMKFLNILSSFSDSELLSSDISSLMDWCAEWSLNLNVSKCVHITFSLLQSSAGSSYFIDSSELDRVETHHDLGVIVSSNLSWSRHYQKVCSQAYQALYMVRRNIPSTASCHLRRELYFDTYKMTNLLLFSVMESHVP